MSARASRSLSLCESTHPWQGSGLAASLAPRPWHEQRFSTSTEPQAPRMLDEPGGSPCPSTALQLVLKAPSMSNELLDETDPLFLSTHQSTVTSFV